MYFFISFFTFNKSLLLLKLFLFVQFRSSPFSKAIVQFRDAVVTDVAGVGVLHETSTTTSRTSKTKNVVVCQEVLSFCAVLLLYVRQRGYNYFNNSRGQWETSLNCPLSNMNLYNAWIVTTPDRSSRLPNEQFCPNGVEATPNTQLF